METRTEETREYRVDGMSCPNCERHVREAVEAVAGVSSASADAEAGLLRVNGPGLDDAAITAAVDDAGYEVKR